ncbi:MAG: rhodanese-related sulfurtransferase [Candidatus Paracaedibacteraceae bacterium]|nr:rhodanese-related sulfurtransferase [Candidatus Paracaedibacteraceae bacterium]
MLVVAALYQFAKFGTYQETQKPLQDLCDQHGVKGTLLLAEEGINGTIAGTRDGIDAVIGFIKSIGIFNNLEYKESHAEAMPFHRMKVRLKKEIVTLGVPDVSPTKKVGTYLNPEQWNEMIQDPDVIVIDTRNDYEYHMGTFKGALNPDTQTFTQFPKFVQENCDVTKHKKVAMFCTGGIRCEKASSYMLEQGFEEVYHLKGGILQYLEDMPEEKSLWDGECFVFDERVGIKHGLEIGEYESCRSCRFPVSKTDRMNPKFEEGVSCPHCYDDLTDKKRARARARHEQVQLAEQRGYKHIGR